MTFKYKLQEVVELQVGNEIRYGSVLRRHYQDYGTMGDLSSEITYEIAYVGVIHEDNIIRSISNLIENT